jgi:type IV pilus assembly protein PilE
MSGEAGQTLLRDEFMRKSMRNYLTSRNHVTGVTLIELMVVVVIIGILAVIGIPSYQRYSMRAQRTEGKAALLRLAANQERFYLQNNTYTNNLAALGFAAGTSENGVYTLAIGAANTTLFQATATPTPGGGTNGVDQTVDADCASFTIDSTGVRTAAPDPAGRCW